jgi:hypothetical protein
LHLIDFLLAVVLIYQSSLLRIGRDAVLDAAQKSPWVMQACSSERILNVGAAGFILLAGWRARSFETSSPCGIYLSAVMIPGNIF